MRELAFSAVYLEVAEIYITGIVPLLNDSAIEAPPYFGPNGVGAHVTIILPEEITPTSLIQFPAWGAQIPFKITHLVSTVPDKQPPAPFTKRVAKLYELTLDAPVLESLRLLAGLDPLIDKKPFHVTVGVKYAAP